MFVRRESCEDSGGVRGKALAPRWCCYGWCRASRDRFADQVHRPSHLYCAVEGRGSRESSRIHDERADWQCWLIGRSGGRGGVRLVRALSPCRMFPWLEVAAVTRDGSGKIRLLCQPMNDAQPTCALHPTAVIGGFSSGTPMDWRRATGNTVVRRRQGRSTSRGSVQGFRLLEVFFVSIARSARCRGDAIGRRTCKAGG